MDQAPPVEYAEGFLRQTPDYFEALELVGFSRLAFGKVLLKEGQPTAAVSKPEAGRRLAASVQRVRVHLQCGLLLVVGQLPVDDPDPAEGGLRATRQERRSREMLTGPSCCSRVQSGGDIRTGHAEVRSRLRADSATQRFPGLDPPDGRQGEGEDWVAGVVCLEV